jgi:hypothetical protein
MSSVDAVIMSGSSRSCSAEPQQLGYEELDLKGVRGSPHSPSPPHTAESSDAEVGSLIDCLEDEEEEDNISLTDDDDDAVMATTDEEQHQEERSKDEFPCEQLPARNAARDRGATNGQAPDGTTPTPPKPECPPTSYSHIHHNASTAAQIYLAGSGDGHTTPTATPRWRYDCI